MNLEGHNAVHNRVNEKGSSSPKIPHTCKEDAEGGNPVKERMMGRRMVDFSISGPVGCRGWGVGFLAANLPGTLHRPTYRQPPALPTNTAGAGQTDHISFSSWIPKKSTGLTSLPLRNTSIF